MATGNNKTIDSAEHVTYRAWLPVEAAGSFEYCFYFSNTVDSTWEDGSTSYAGKSGGKYTIESASIADGGTEFDPNVEPDSMEAVTFSGNSQKEVAPDETFWSDPVTLDVPKDHYLLWEWTVTGTEIPCICMSNMTYAYADQGNGKGFNYVNEIPLPQLFGCKREVKTRIVTLGDSVTQGCQTSDNAYQFWAAQTLDQLGTEDYSLWNLGLGYARATDCAAGGDWLNRAVAGADLITVAFGTNDIISGPYGGSGHATAAEIEDAVRTITKKCTDSGVQIIVWNSPPFDLSAELEPIRTVRIAGDDYPAELVKSKFMKLNSEHIRFVFDCLRENTTKVRNIKQYLRAMLFNAPSTISNYYTSLVAHDMAQPDWGKPKSGLPDYSCSPDESL